MRPLPQQGVFEDRGALWTRNRVPGRKVYGERLRTVQGKEFREWTPYRSKVAALLRRLPRAPWPDTREDLLYLGASTGTTLSHLSDLWKGLLIAVEFSPRSVRDLVWNMEPRENVVPVFEDAGHPERYMAYLSRPVGALVQDVAQRNQVEIFLRNLPLLRHGGLGLLFIKARSMDVAAPVADIYERVRSMLLKAGLRIEHEVDLDPYELDHRAFVVVRP